MYNNNVDSNKIRESINLRVKLWQKVYSQQFMKKLTVNMEALFHTRIIGHFPNQTNNCITLKVSSSLIDGTSIDSIKDMIYLNFIRCVNEYIDENKELDDFIDISEMIRTISTSSIVSICIVPHTDKEKVFVIIGL